VKFKTSDNLIDLLVGQNLYSNPDVAMRELLQNAEDACHLQSLNGSEFEPEIVVRVSAQGNWVEVLDNGIGMDSEVFEESFATIGASKSNSPKLQALIAKAGTTNRPIGQFGIGVLSCFGVADTVEIYSLADGAAPVSVRIPDQRAPFEILNDHRESRGTTIRLQLKPGGPMQAIQVEDSLRRYVRHAQHIYFENVDSGERTLVAEQWAHAPWDAASRVSADVIESGYLRLSDAWESINHALDTQLTLCNAGFFVSNSASVLPDFALGAHGEINVRPGGLTILMDREGFQQDARWNSFVEMLTARYRSLVASRLESWLALDLSLETQEKLRAMQRIVLLLLRSPLGAVAGAENQARARRLLSSVLLLSEGKAIDLDGLLQGAMSKPPLYAYRIDEQQQVQRSFSDQGQSLSLTETIKSLDLRVSLLKINGFSVVRTERHNYSVRAGSTQQNLQIHDFDVLAEACSSAGVELRRVQDAPSAHTSIGSSPDAEAITGLFEMSANLKIQSVDNMTDGIIADFSGYILNLQSPEIRHILESMPASVGNPLRRDLLSAYLALSIYDVSRARSLIFGLITDPDFENKARRTTGRFFRAYLAERVKALLQTAGASQ
jgi:hypothetical protein